MIKVTFKPQRDEFSFIKDEYEELKSLVQDVSKHMTAPHILEKIDRLEKGIIVVWYPNGGTTRCNTFVGLQ